MVIIVTGIDEEQIHGGGDVALPAKILKRRRKLNIVALKEMPPGMRGGPGTVVEVGADDGSSTHRGNSFKRKSTRPGPNPEFHDKPGPHQERLGEYSLQMFINVIGPSCERSNLLQLLRRGRQFHGPPRHHRPVESVI
jgi:hypothetical protein